MYPRCCRINFGFYSSTPVDKEPKLLIFSFSIPSVLMPYLSKFNKLKKTLDNLESFFTWLRPNLPGGFPPSTFSAKELNFCVRNGNRCILLAIVTTLFN